MFSVIVPSYNQGCYLEEALNSVLAQTCKTWECIIVNDGSEDETENVALHYCKVDNRFKYISTENKGVSAARNAGIRMAQYNYILPLDADDKIAQYYLEKAQLAFSKNPSLTLVYGEAKFFGDSDGVWKLPNYSFYQLLLMNMIYCSAIFKKTAFLEVGGYSTEMIYGHEDWDLWLRLLKGNAKVLKLSEVVFFYRKKQFSRTTILKNTGKLEETQKKLIQRNKEIYIQHLHRIIKDLEKCKVENVEKKRALTLIKSSKAYKLSSKLSSLKLTLRRFINL